ADRALPVDDTGKNLGAAEIDSDDELRLQRAATITPRMPGHDKPYRVYRGGRVKGRVPLERRLEQPGAPGGSAGPRPRRRWRLVPRRFRWKLALALALPVVLVLVLLWGVGSYLALSNGIGSANDRVPQSVRRLLTTQGGLLSSKATTILVLGTDG